jgi:L-arabinose isomerase
MGDFLVEDAEMLERFGVKVVYPEQGELAKYRAEVNEDDVKAEMQKDLDTLYQIEPVDAESHARTVRNCLAVRRWIEEQKLSAMTVNFREITEATGLEIMPFMEACKAMARGTGYAGEGDVLTASLVGALMKGYDEVAFIEIFCPDWKGNTLLLSHMGEYNPNLTSGKCGMKEIPFIYGDAKNPVVSYGRYKGGDAVFINLYRTKDDFRMIISAVDMVEVRPDDDTLEVRVRGWMKPKMPIADFLEAISRVGATHHSALVYGATVSELVYFADLLGIGYDIV